MKIANKDLAHLGMMSPNRTKKFKLKTKIGDIDELNENFQEEIKRQLILYKSTDTGINQDDTVNY